MAQSVLPQPLNFGTVMADAAATAPYHCHLLNGDTIAGEGFQIDHTSRQLRLTRKGSGDIEPYPFEQISHLYHGRPHPLQQQQSFTIHFADGASLSSHCMGAVEDEQGHHLYHIDHPHTAIHLFIPAGSPHTVTLSAPVTHTPSTGGASTIELVSALLEEGIAAGASDIHLRPLQDRVEVKFRIDGEMVLIRQLEPDRYPALVSRIKILGNMDIAEHHKPQDGSHHLLLEGRQVDLRISTVIVVEGESIAIRILDPKTGLRTLQEIGFRENDEHRLASMLQQRSGLILVTGPTGSGKSTTLYAAMRALREQQLNIISLEDPVEYRIDQVRQIEISQATGNSFATNLRHLLRHDPDVIFIGEIRDEETAHIALQSAYTGHLVLSTLHTGDAPSAIPRLLEMGIESYTLQDTLIGVLSQRLVRKVCPHCRGEVEAMKRCDHCHQSGYKGRMPLYELMQADEELRSQIRPGVTAQQIRTLAISAGMVPMTEYAKVLIEQHNTQAEEVARHDTT